MVDDVSFETLRDRFAMAALPSVVLELGSSIYNPAIVADFSYRIADAMLRQRCKPSTEDEALPED